MAPLKSKVKCLTKQEAVNHIRCWDEWTPANELWQDPFGSFELATGSVSGLSGEGAVLWSLSGMVIRLWPLHSFSASVSVSKWDWDRPRCALLRSSETRDPWSGRLPVSSLLPETPSDRTTAAWRHFGCSLVSRVYPCPRRLSPSTMLTTSSLADQGADHPGLVSNPCLHLP